MAHIEVCEVMNPAHQAWVGQTISTLSKQQHKDPLDTFFDLAIADEVRHRVRSPYAEF